MTFEVLNSVSEFSAVRARCMYSLCAQPIIAIEDEDVERFIGDAQVGKVVHIHMRGTLKKLRECFNYIRLKRADKMLLLLCAPAEVATSDIDGVVRLFAAAADEGAHGLALTEDNEPGYFTADVFLKYDPQSGLKL